MVNRLQYYTILSPLTVVLLGNSILLSAPCSSIIHGEVSGFIGPTLVSLNVLAVCAVMPSKQITGEPVVSALYCLMR
jgi:hypothetical protein